MILSQLKASQWNKTLKFSSERKNGSTSFVTLFFTVSFFCDVLFTTVAFFNVFDTTDFLTAVFLWSCHFGLPFWMVPWNFGGKHTIHCLQICQERGSFQCLLGQKERIARLHLRLEHGLTPSHLLLSEEDYFKLLELARFEARKIFPSYFSLQTPLVPPPPYCLQPWAPPAGSRSRMFRPEGDYLPNHRKDINLEIE